MHRCIPSAEAYTRRLRFHMSQGSFVITCGLPVRQSATSPIGCDEPIRRRKTQKMHVFSKNDLKIHVWYDIFCALVLWSRLVRTAPSHNTPRDCPEAFPKMYVHNRE